MKTLFRFEGLWTGIEWLAPCWVRVDAKGCIQTISDTEIRPHSDEVMESVYGYAIPGFQNAHSHAFQYAMAGHAEHLPQGAGSDDFWSWRNAMYELALSLQPEQIEAIATLLYSEMVRHGYTSVAEFHYVHHDIHGHPYADRALIGKHLIRAAERAGIRLTLIPIFYQMGGFGRAAEDHQRRFLSRDLSEYMQLFEATQEATRSFEHACVGLGIHSLRAVCAEDVIQAYQSCPDGIPRHIHVSEQQKEVDACMLQTGMRPVEWMLQHLELGPEDHLVHATHIDQNEIEGLAQAEAHVVLCPSTEGNLGDGFFPLVPFVQAGGRWSIGTDSHIGLSPFEELRWLDYGQRLLHQKRNVLCLQEGDDSGQIAFRQALSSGRAAMGTLQSFGQGFSVGSALDAVLIDAAHPTIQMTPPERMLSTIVYTLDASALLGTLNQGRWIVQKQKHLHVDYTSLLHSIRAIR